MKTISPAELSALLVTHPRLTILDVRTPVEFAEVHVAQACNVPLVSGEMIFPENRRFEIPFFFPGLCFRLFS